MEEYLRLLIANLPMRLKALLEAEPMPITSLPKGLPERGIYLLSEGSEYLYVGRSNRIGARLRNHRRPSGGHNSATFAFRIARIDTGRLKAAYRTDGSRSELEKDPSFKAAFLKAKERVSRMQVRVVEEKDPVQQSLLEVYAADFLKTPYNDFDNH